MANQEITITRIFNAPREEVWKAWTDPDQIKTWWGPKNYSAPVIKSDFRIGGSYLYSMLSPEGQMMWSTGTFQDIRYLEKIVATDSFADENGNVVPAAQYGMQGLADELLITVTFEDMGDKTKLTIHHRDFPTEMVDMCVTGWEESLDKLEAALRSHFKPQELSL